MKFFNNKLMALELTAKLIKILPSQKFAGKSGDVSKQQFIVETQETYPKSICFTAMAEKAEAIKNLAIGDTIKISFFIESREFNDRWYTDLRVWKIEKLIYKDALSTPNIGEPDDLPEENITPSTPEKDDLPF